MRSFAHPVGIDGTPPKTNRLFWLNPAASVLMMLWLIKVLLEILYEYRWYFPLNFTEARFLIGRESSFSELYRIVFFAHLFSGPSALVLGVFLYVTAQRRAWRESHRWAGRVQAILILGLLVPSGLVMSAYAFTGAIAGAGFALHSLLTGYCTVRAVRSAMKRRLQSHRQWAQRLLLLLLAPLILRSINGFCVTLQIESAATYQMTAWACWLLPLIAHDAWQRIGSSGPSSPLTIEGSHEIASRS